MLIDNSAPLARLGYKQYTAVNNVFNMEMPIMPDDHGSGGILGRNVPESLKR